MWDIGVLPYPRRRMEYVHARAMLTISFSADECRVSSCKTWDALTLPDYKDATAANKAPFNIAYDTNLDYFQYVSSERPDIGNRAKKAMAGKGFNLGQYLSRELSSSVHTYPS